MVHTLPMIKIKAFVMRQKKNSCVRQAPADVTKGLWKKSVQCHIYYRSQLYRPGLTKGPVYI